MRTYLLVALGGALGSVARFWVGNWMAVRLGHTFPWGTLFANVTGCFAIGLFASFTMMPGRDVSDAGRTFFMVGVCGGYTTFSSFALQSMNLTQQNRGGFAAGNVLGSVVLCLGAVYFGHLIGTMLAGSKR
jgi:CrcB protein